MLILVNNAKFSMVLFKDFSLKKCISTCQFIYNSVSIWLARRSLNSTHTVSQLKPYTGEGFLENRGNFVISIVISKQISLCDIVLVFGISTNRLRKEFISTDITITEVPHSNLL